MCSFCSLDETILYILRDCKIAKKHLDFYLNQIQHIHSFSLHSDLLTWLQENCFVDVDLNRFLPWRIFFPIACWQIWLLKIAKQFSTPLNHWTSDLNPSRIQNIATEYYLFGTELSSKELTQNIPIFITWSSSLPSSPHIPNSTIMTLPLQTLVMVILVEFLEIFMDSES